VVNNTYIRKLHKYFSDALFKVGQRNTLMKETELKHVSVRYICKDAILSIVYRLFLGQKCSLILLLTLTDFILL